MLEDGAPPVSMGAELAKRSNVAGAMIHDMEAYLDLTIATADEDFSTICAGRMRYMIYAHQSRLSCLPVRHSALPPRSLP